MKILWHKTFVNSQTLPFSQHENFVNAKSEMSSIMCHAHTHQAWHTNKEFTDQTLRSMTWHTLTNQKPIPISPDGTMSVLNH